MFATSIKFHSFEVLIKILVTINDMKKNFFKCRYDKMIKN